MRDQNDGPPRIEDCSHTEAKVRTIGFYPETGEVEIEVECQSCLAVWEPLGGVVDLGPPARKRASATEEKA